MKSKNWFWGIFFVTAAILVVVNQFGYFNDVGLFSLLLTLLLLPIIVKSILCLNFAGILFPAAFLCIIYAKPLGVTNLTPWTVLLAALFGSIGLSILFHKRKYSDFHFQNNCRHNKNENFKNVINSPDENVISFGVSFGASVKYVNSQELRKANLSANFGSLKVYFDNAGLSQEGAEINFNISFAEVKMYVPKTWNLVNNINVSLGGVEEKNSRGKSEGPVILLTGNVSFSGVEIIYV